MKIGTVGAKRGTMKTPFLFLTAVAACCVLGAPLTSRAADADNSSNNVVDRSADAKTPESQSNADADVAVTRAIRKAIIHDSSLSVYAHNVKIITTKEHQVFLRGAVSSSDECSKIESLAKQNAGDYPVQNQLSVKNK
jgi:osmotically-inducible protein OsmY